MYESHREGLTPITSQMMDVSSKDSSPEILPSLASYRNEHSVQNLQKLCAEIAQLCREVYASTQNATERAVYFGTLEKLMKSKI